MSSPRTVLLIAGCFLALGIASGCSGDSGIEPVGTSKPAKPSAEARRQLKDAGSPASVVAEFWQSLQRGALPLSLEKYDRKVIRAIGIANFAGMLASQQPQVKDSRLSVLRIDEVSGGRVVSGEGLPKDGPKVQHSFFLRRRNGRWVIAYDTLSAAALQTYIQTRAQDAIDPGAKAPAAKAVRAAAEVIDTYRQAGLSSEPPDRRNQGRRPPRSPEPASPGPPAAAPSPSDADQAP